MGLFCGLSLSLEKVLGEIGSLRTAESSEVAVADVVVDGALDPLLADRMRSQARSEGRLEAEEAEAGRRRDGVGAGGVDP